MFTAQIRSKLYPFARLVFTPKFDKRYQQYQQTNRQPPETVMQTYQSETDQFVQSLAAAYAREPYTIRRLVSDADDPVLFTLFLRYHILTSALASEPQDTDHALVADDAGFIVFLLDTLWASFL